MSDNNRMYQPYLQLIDVISKETDEEKVREMILRISKHLINYLDIDKMVKEHEKRFKDVGIRADSSKLLEPIEKAKNKLEMLIQFTFIINKCTKIPKIAVEDTEYKLSKSQNLETLLEGLTSSSPEIEKALEMALSDYRRHNNPFSAIHKNINSLDDNRRTEALRNIANMSEDTFISYYLNDASMTTEEILYKMKDKLMSAIIKEIGDHPSKYGDYQVGFIKDSQNGEYFLAINIPNNLGTYQFHMDPLVEKSIIYDSRCLEAIKHPLQGLVGGSTNISKMSYLFTSQELSDVATIERRLNELKASASRITTIPNSEQEKELREIFLYSTLLGKNPIDELRRANPSIADYFIQERKCGLESFVGKRTIEEEGQYNAIKDNILKYKKVYITSKSVDSKVAAEVLRRLGHTKGKNVHVEVIEPRNKTTTTRCFYWAESKWM